MKISVLIIAHNEEKYVAQCIESLLEQTLKADEIVLLSHNSTDGTEALAKKYPISVISHSGPKGIPYARIEGLDRVSGDLILCIDGDSYAAQNWIEEMSKAAAPDNVLTGSWVKFKGPWLAFVESYFNRLLCSLAKDPSVWIWGPSFGIWKKDVPAVKDIYQNTTALSGQLGLSRNPEDYWLACFMKKKGKLGFTRKTFVVAHTKERTSFGFFMRANVENVRNVMLVRNYFNKK